MCQRQPRCIWHDVGWTTVWPRLSTHNHCLMLNCKWWWKIKRHNPNFRSENCLWVQRSHGWLRYKKSFTRYHYLDLVEPFGKSAGQSSKHDDDIRAAKSFLKNLLLFVDSQYITKFIVGVRYGLSREMQVVRQNKILQCRHIKQSTHVLSLARLRYLKPPFLYEPFARHWNYQPPCHYQLCARREEFHGLIALLIRPLFWYFPSQCVYCNLYTS